MTGEPGGPPQTDVPMEIADSVLDLIGNTPMVRLRRVSAVAGIDAMLALKMEPNNPGGSAKDRPALEMVLAAEQAGLLSPGGTIVEPTSGNTGVGPAIVAAERGYDCVFVVTDKVAPEKVDLLRAYGARVVICPVAVPPDHPDSYYVTAERLVAEIPGAYRPNQYANPANPRAHLISTGPEIWRQTAGRVTHFVAGAGTCGTLTGVARYLKAQDPDVRVVAADPEGPVFSGGSGRPYLVEGVGEDFFPTAWDPSLVDEVIAVSDQESFLTARHVARVEGILVGGSGGLAVAAALRVARRCGPDDVVVVLNPDSGRGYLSRVFNDEWMATHGFLTDTSDASVGEVLDSRAPLPDLLYVNPSDRARRDQDHARQRGQPVAGLQERTAVLGRRSLWRGQRAGVDGCGPRRSDHPRPAGRALHWAEPADDRHRPASAPRGTDAGARAGPARPGRRTTAHGPDPGGRAVALRRSQPPLRVR